MRAGRNRKFGGRHFMADHMVDLKSGSSDVSSERDSKPKPVSNFQKVFLPAPKRAKRLKRRHSVKSSQEREGRHWSRGLLVFVVVFAVVSGALWVGLWHIPGLAPWPLLATDAKGHNLAGEISLLWIFQFFHKGPFNGYDWNKVEFWLSHHGLLRAFGGRKKNLLEVRHWFWF